MTAYCLVNVAITTLAIGQYLPWANIFSTISPYALCCIFLQRNLSCIISYIVLCCRFFERKYKHKIIASEILLNYFAFFDLIAFMSGKNASLVLASVHSAMGRRSVSGENASQLRG